MSLQFQIIKHNSKEYDETVRLRDEILRKPLGLNFTPDQLQQESELIHVACYSGGQLLACLILQPHGERELKMRQVAVSGHQQGKGVGKALVEFSEQYAKENGYKKISMNARDTAVGFYLRLGYSVEGEPFEEVTIPHRHMFKIVD